MTASAQAQEPSRWTGFYAGLNAGTLTTNDYEARVASETRPLFFQSLMASGYIPQVPVANNGFIGGVQAGYNTTLSGFIVGAETDMQWVKATTAIGTAPVVSGSGTVTQVPVYVQRSQNWLGTTRAKLGITPMPYLLVYGTGGLAYGDTSLTVSVLGSNNNLATTQPSQQTQSQVKLGYTAGAGFELSVAERWSVKGEMLYFDLGSSTVTNNSAYTTFSSGMTTTVFENGFIYRAGINYRF